MSERAFNAGALKRDRHFPVWMVKQCRGKVRHATREQAEVVRLARPLGDCMNSYPCERCRGWHLGGLQSSHRGRRP